MYKYILLTLAMVLGLQYQSGAQELINEAKRQHIVHLNNGSSIIGVLVEYRDDRLVTIEVADGERIQIPHASIQSLEPITQKTAKSVIRKSKTKDNSYSFKETGWHYSSNFGLISRGSSNFDNKIGLSLDANATYHFTRLFGLGLSLGYDSYEEGGFQDYVPIQVVVTGYLSPKNVTLFYTLSAGYGIAISDQEKSEWLNQSNKGGFIFYPKIGIRLSGHDGVNTTLFSGIKIQKSTLERRWGEEFEESIIQERTFKRFIIGIGIVF